MYMLSELGQLPQHRCLCPVIIVNRDCYYYGAWAGYYSKERTTLPKPGGSPLLDLTFTRLAELVGCSSFQPPVASREERSRMWTIAFQERVPLSVDMFCSSISNRFTGQGTTAGFQGLVPCLLLEIEPCACSACANYQLPKERAKRCAVTLCGATRAQSPAKSQ
ncbi:hypothetical protein BDV11DRAFT_185846 [Aspergillus similis]